MKYRRMGRTGLKVSEICLGTMIYGDQVEEARSLKIIRKALDSGVNFLDTADMYVEGKSEEIVGKALKGHRDSVVLATKVANRTGPGPNDVGLSRKHIMKAIEDSLRRLKTDYIDIYYVHLPDYETPIEESLHALDDLVHQGKVRYIACSNFRAWQLCKALWVSDIQNLARFDCIQPPYNLITRDIEYELLPLCVGEGVGVCVYNPLSGGLLTGKHDPKKSPEKGTRFDLKSIGKMYYERYWLEANFEAVNRLKTIARKFGPPVCARLDTEQRDGDISDLRL
jgi:aryl-alcohol dehydrogenase (NADP+)